MILSAIAAKLKQRAKADFRDRHFEAILIVQAVSWYLRKGFAFAGVWTVREQNQLLACCFGLPASNKA